MITEVKIGQIWKHKGRGSLYEITNLETFQTAICEELDDAKVVSYRGTDGEPYAREISEFTDGRFEFVKHRSTYQTIANYVKLSILAAVFINLFCLAFIW